MTPRLRMRPAKDAQWWDALTAPLLEFIGAGPSRTWSEVVAWGFARGYVDAQKQRRGTCEVMSQMVAYLDNARRIVNLRHGADAPALWSVREDDGTGPCQHGRMSCDVCGWVSGRAGAQRTG